MPSKYEEVWRQFATEIGAEFVEGEAGADKVVAKVNQWTIMLDTYTDVDLWGTSYGSTKYETRPCMTALYVTRDGFQFEFYRPGLIAKLRNILGMQDIEVGYPDFDREFVIKGNDEPKVRALFANQRIPQLAQARPAAHVKILNVVEALFVERIGAVLQLYGGQEQIYERIKSKQDEFINQLRDDPTRVLFTKLDSLAKDVEHLKRLYELFAEMLNQLYEIGSASEEAPGITP